MTTITIMNMSMDITIITEMRRVSGIVQLNDNDSKKKERR